MKLRNKKTGGIINAGDTFTLASFDEYGLNVRERYEYGSLSELCKEWEDYKPAEPLIKDEKIRKAVRAWADANEFEPKYTAKYHSSCYILSSWQGDIEFNSPIKGLEDEKEYTVAELCGEEE